MCSCCNAGDLGARGMQEASVVLPRRRPIVVPLRSWAALQPAFSSDHPHHAVCHSHLPAFCAALGVGARHGWRGSALRRPSRVPQDAQVEVARSRLRADVRPARCSLSLPNPLAAPALQALQGGPSRLNLAEEPNQGSLKDRGERIPPLQRRAPPPSSCRCLRPALPTQPA